MSSSGEVTSDTWITAFLGVVGHEYYDEVSEDFIEDDFNMTGLLSQVPRYKEALEMILDIEPESESYTESEPEGDSDDVEAERRATRDGRSTRDPAGGDDSEDAYMHDNPSRGPGGDMDSEEVAYRKEKAREERKFRDYDAIDASAELLYGLIHQRFITSRPGIQQMMEKYESGHFGTCPRVFCRGAKVLPVGVSDIPGQDTVKLFCPACLDVYSPPNSRFHRIDGAFFGTTFGCLFFMTFPELDVGGTRPLEISNRAVSEGSPAPPLPPPPVPSSSATLDNKTTKEGSARSTAIPPSKQSQSNNKKTPAPKVINGVAVHNLAPGLGKNLVFEPRIYGFRVSELSKTGPRMKWLRQKPDTVEELDEVMIWESTQAEYTKRQAQTQRLTKEVGEKSKESEKKDHDEEVDDDVDDADDKETMRENVEGKLVEDDEEDEVEENDPSQPPTEVKGAQVSKDNKSGRSRKGSVASNSTDKNKKKVGAVI